MRRGGLLSVRLVLMFVGLLATKAGGKSQQGSAMPIEGGGNGFTANGLLRLRATRVRCSEAKGVWHKKGKGTASALSAHRAALLGMRGGEPWAAGIDAKEKGGEGYDEDDDQPESAAWIYQGALEKDPTDPGAMAALGWIKYTVENNTEEAETLFVSALQNYPEHRPALHNMGMLQLHARENYERATHFLSRAVASDPTHVSSLHTYARLLHVHTKNYDKAEEMYKRGLQLCPQSGEMLTDYGQLLENVRGDKQAALGLYSMAADLSPGSPIVQCHQARGMEMRGEIAQAETLYRRTLASHPSHVPSLCNLGLLLYARKSPREPNAARALWERSLSIQPGHTDTLVNFATYMMENELPRTAYEMLTDALKVDPNKVEAMCSMGVILETRAQQLFKEMEYGQAQGEIDALLNRADGHYAKALSIQPSHVDTLCNRAALLHCHKGEPGQKQAEKLYRQVLEVSPQHAGAIFNLGFLMQQEGKVRDAMELFERAYELDPEKPAFQQTLCRFTQSKYYEELSPVRGQPLDAVDRRLKMHEEHWGAVKKARLAAGGPAEWVVDDDPVPYNRGSFGGDFSGVGGGTMDDSEEIGGKGVW